MDVQANFQVFFKVLPNGTLALSDGPRGSTIVKPAKRGQRRVHFDNLTKRTTSSPTVRIPKKHMYEPSRHENEDIQAQSPSKRRYTVPDAASPTIHEYSALNQSESRLGERMRPREFERNEFRNLLGNKKSRVFKTLKSVENCLENEYGLRVKPIRGDGYCLMNALLHSYMNATNQNDTRGVAELVKNMIMNEVLNNKKYYAFFNKTLKTNMSKKNLIQQLLTYINQEDEHLWDEDFTDLLPAMFANAMRVNLVIYCVKRILPGPKYGLTLHCQAPRYGTNSKTPTVYLYYLQDRSHYDALVSIRHLRRV